MREARGPQPGHAPSTNASPAAHPTAGKSTLTSGLGGGGGEPLPGGVRERFEDSLCADLSTVRVHTGTDSAAAADAVGAQAFAVGSDIHFGAGKYQPDDPYGLHLLAHEVAHTRQQSGGPAAAQHKLAVSQPGDSLEAEADRAADAMVRGAPSAVSVGVGSMIARSPSTPAPTYKHATHAGPNHDKTIDWNNPPQFYGLAGSQATSMREQYKVHLRGHLMSEKDIVALGVGYEPEAIVQRLEAAAKDQSASSTVADAADAAIDAIGGLLGGSSGKIDIEKCRKALWRSAQRAIADTLSTETSDARYKKKGATTYCNVYSTDMVNAMGGYLPRVWYADLDNPTKLPKEKLEKVPVIELSANYVGAWLNKWGSDFGWTRTTSAKQAQEAANAGNVAIIQASKIDGVSAGHVGVIMAEGNGHAHTTGKDSKGGETYQPLQSQAGASNFKYSDAAPTGGGISDDWWKGDGMKDESTTGGNFYIYKGGHKATAVAGSAEMGKAS